jgi:hypothetical protein
MEPFRPIVDKCVVEIVLEYGSSVELSPDLKRLLVGQITGRQTLDGEARTLFDILGRTAASLVDALSGKATRIVYPKPD